LHGIKGTLNKIRKFIWFYLWFYETNREWATIVMLDLKTNKRFLETDGYLLVKKFTSKCITLAEEGKEEGCIRKDIDPYIFRSMVIGTIENLTIRWLLLNKPKNLVSYADGVADLVIAAVKP
jgi:TetR/AcrR family fatty acid metabolism transcriptional regulator